MTCVCYIWWVGHFIFIKRRLCSDISKIIGTFLNKRKHLTFLIGHNQSNSKHKKWDPQLMDMNLIVNLKISLRKLSNSNR
ncbi:hypothetical protein CICLE_v10003019mg [Citrus x clementina]|uniref:Uncharacterized protein n=1 Tax=Citrus clementina TaxID=85681 RepID=V4TE81_CITCL|nr:hypothetical protein CICLE_v10003019mg [Citrus x clementina]